MLCICTLPGVIREQMMHHKCTSRGIIIIMWQFWSKEVELKVAAGTNKPEHKTTALYCFFHFHHKKWQVSTLGLILLHMNPQFKNQMGAVCNFICCCKFTLMNCCEEKNLSFWSWEDGCSCVTNTIIQLSCDWRQGEKMHQMTKQQ